MKVTIETKDKEYRNWLLNEAWKYYEIAQEGRLKRCLICRKPITQTDTTLFADVPGELVHVECVEKQRRIDYDNKRL